MLNLVCDHCEATVIETVALGTVEVAGKLMAFIVADTASMARGIV